MVQLSDKEFAKLVKQMDKYKQKIEDLTSTVRYLNKQIEAYNAEFGRKNDNERLRIRKEL